MKQYITYIDEAGNTGDNLLDLHQPLFVLAAVSVPVDKQIQEKQIREAHFLAVKEKEETEIKATKWYKAPKKQQAMSLLLQELQVLGTKLHLVVTEKRYMIAGWAINTFFDYANVGSDDMSFVNDGNKRRATADRYEQNCTDEELASIGQALRNPTREGYLRAIGILRQRAPEQSSIDILNSAERNVDELLAVETSHDNLFGDSVFHTPNLTSLHALGNMIAQMCKEQEAQTSFIFDDCSLCNKAFLELYKIDSNINEDFSIPTLPNHFTWKDRVLSFKTANSKSESLLQAADVLATCTDKLLQKVGGGATEFTVLEKSILMQLGLTFGENQLWMVSSQKLKQQFAKATRFAAID
jgi:hypothetical protein